jgi:hypothetical protein
MSVGSAVGKTLLDVAGKALRPIAPMAKAMGVEMESKAFRANLEESAAISAREIGTQVRRLTQSGRAFLNTQGPSSQFLAHKIDTSENEAHVLAGEWARRWDEAIEGIFGKKGASKSDLYHVSDISEGLVTAKSDKHLQASQAWDGLMDEVSEMAQEHNLKEIQGGVWHSVYNKMMKVPVVGPDGVARPRTHAEAAALATKEARRSFTPREMYVPHYYSETAIREVLDDPVKMDEAIKIFINRGYAETKEDAANVVRAYLRQPAEFRGGPLQHTRELDQLIQGGYEKDLRKVGARYFYSAAKRLKAAEHFGADDELFTKELLPRIAAEGGNAQVANNLYLAFADTVDPKFRELSKLTGTLHAITLLSTAGIAQPSQLANVVARTGWTNTLKSMIHTMKDWRGSRRFAEHTGAIIDSIHQDMSIDSPSDLSKVWLRVIGLEHLDRYNRVVAALAGRFHSQELAERLAKGNLKGYQLNKTLRYLQKYGIDGDSVFKQGGKLTADQMRVAGYKTAKDTQFATSVLDMPEFRTTPAGRFMYLFKSFAFQQARFIKDELLEEAKLGNMGPTNNYMAVSLGVGSVMGPAIRGLKGREEPDDPLLVEIENWATVGAFGMYWDAGRAMWHGPSSVVNWAAGPTFSELLQLGTSDVAGIGRGVIREGEPDFGPLVRHLVRRAPLIGPKLHNLWYGE